MAGVGRGRVGVAGVGKERVRGGRDDEGWPWGRPGLTIRLTRHVPRAPSVWGAPQVLNKNVYIVPVAPRNRHDISKSQM